MNIRRVRRRLVGRLADTFASPSQQERLWGYLYHRVRGENLDDPRENGEYALMSRLADWIGNQEAAVCDVGANLGEWTLQFTALAGDRVSIYAFEPVAATFVALEQNLSHSLKKGRATTIRVALSDRDGECDMHVSDGTAGSNSLHPRVGTMVRPTRVERVRLMRGDTFAAERKIGEVAFVKIDTEGHELNVIQGFDRLLGAGRIGALQFEYGGTWIDSRRYLRDAFDLLARQYGYCLGKIHAHRVVFREQYSQRDENFAYANWLAVRPELRAAFETA